MMRYGCHQQYRSRINVKRHEEQMRPFKHHKRTYQENNNRQTAGRPRCSTPQPCGQRATFHADRFATETHWDATDGQRQSRHSRAIS